MAATAAASDERQGSAHRLEEASGKSGAGMWMGREQSEKRTTMVDLSDELWELVVHRLAPKDQLQLALASRDLCRTVGWRLDFYKRAPLIRTEWSYRMKLPERSSVRISWDGSAVAAFHRPAVMDGHLLVHPPKVYWVEVPRGHMSTIVDSRLRGGLENVVMSRFGSFAVLANATRVLSAARPPASEPPRLVMEMGRTDGAIVYNEIAISRSERFIAVPALWWCPAEWTLDVTDARGGAIRRIRRSSTQGGRVLPGVQEHCTAEFSAADKLVVVAEYGCFWTFEPPFFGDETRSRIRCGPLFSPRELQPPTPNSGTSFKISDDDCIFMYSECRNEQVFAVSEPLGSAGEELHWTVRLPGVDFSLQALNPWSALRDKAGRPYIVRASHHGIFDPPSLRHVDGSKIMVTEQLTARGGTTYRVTKSACGGPWFVYLRTPPEPDAPSHLESSMFYDPTDSARTYDVIISVTNVLPLL